VEGPDLETHGGSYLTPKRPGWRLAGRVEL
jgi:hypothetical protein